MESSTHMHIVNLLDIISCKLFAVENFAVFTDWLPQKFSSKFQQDIVTAKVFHREQFALYST